VRAADRVAVVAGAVNDPELPPLTLADLGIFRGASVDEHGAVVVRITPTYSGCPATEMIADDVREALRRDGWYDVTVRTELAPAWSSDEVTEEGRRKLAALGIVPPPRGAGASSCLVRAAAGGDPGCQGASGVPRQIAQPVRLALRCPRCGSGATEVVSAFSSTPCKALHRCCACAEPFERFKAL